MSNIIFSRQHKTLTTYKSTWEQCKKAYAGGETHIKEALVKHIAEIDDEYAERQKRAYYFNYPRAIAQRITSFALAVEPMRQDANTDVVADMSRTGFRANDVMRQASTMLTIYGRLWLRVDNVSYSGDADLERVQTERLRPYVAALTPLEVIDWAYGTDGRLLWLIAEEEHVYDSDPMKETVRVKRRRLWKRDMWELYEVSADSKVSLLDIGPNPTGQIPFVEVMEPDGYGIDGNHWFEDVVRISNAIMNNESEAQMNTVKQMFGLLVISETFKRSTEKETKVGTSGSGISAIIARSAALCENKEESGISRYIAPSGIETTTIRSENKELKIELYEVVGLAMQSKSREAQSSESKSWDFQNTAQFLANRADILENAELKVWKLISAWDKSIAVPKITYNRKFAVRDLEKSIAGLLQISSVSDVGIEMRKQILRTARELLNEIAEIDDKTNKAIDTEIDKTEPAPVPSFNYMPSGDVDKTAPNVDGKADSNEKSEQGDEQA